MPTDSKIFRATNLEQLREKKKHYRIKGDAKEYYVFYSYHVRIPLRVVIQFAIVACVPL